MNHTRTRRWTAGAAITTLLVGVLSFVLMQPAQANHGGRSLEVSPEVRTVSLLGGSVLLTARLGPGDSTGAVDVDFEFEGGPADTDGNTPSTPDATCTMAAVMNPADARTCQVTVSATAASITANTGGTTIVRAWVDEDRTDGSAGGGTEADRAEGRLSSTVTDCTTETNSTDFQACQSGTAVPGAAEPDATDVVQISFTRVNAALRLDCDELTLAPTGQNATIRCVVSDEDQLRRSGVKLDAENMSGANNTDGTGGSTADSDDSCTSSNADGSCVVVISGASNQIDFATVCVWADTDGDTPLSATPASYAPTGSEEGDGSLCDDEPLSPDNAANATDVVRAKWEDRALTTLDAQPDGPSPSLAGGTHALTIKLTDQFGAAWEPNVTVNGELFAGSPNDGDGASAASPDFSCPTDSGTTGDVKGECTVSYTGANAGFDVMCFWFGGAPTLAGTGADGTCDGERIETDGAVARLDVVSKTWTSPPPPSTTTTSTTTTQPSGGGGGSGGGATTAQGYSLVGEDGSLYAFGTAKNFGDMKGKKLNAPIIGVAYTPGGNGYWLVAKDGGIFTFGDADFFGSMGDKKLNSPVIGMAATPTGKGYWLFAGDGGIFTFGDAEFFGSMGDKPLNKPVINMEPLASGNGYWLVAADGGIFSFGKAEFFGSRGSEPVNQPIFDMTSTDTDKGYWLIARDGGVFSYGDAEAKFYGNPVNETNPKPTKIIGMDSTPSATGYWIADATGKVWNYGDAQALGDRFGSANPAPMIGLASVPSLKP